MKRNLLIFLALMLSSLSSVAQEIPDSSRDAWYWCTYSYRYSILSGNKKDYIESKEKDVTAIINAFKRELHIYYSVYALYGAPAILVWDDKENVYRDDENTFMLSSDFGYLTLLDDGDNDVFRLMECYEGHGIEEYEEDEDIDLIWDIDDEQDEKELNWVDYLLYILLALLPAIALLIFILWRDRLRPEPAKELILACVMGLLSLPIALLIGNVLQEFGLFSEDTSTWLGCLKVSFFGAAIPEEFGKLVILWLFFKWRKHQNEFMDGIVYAACIGLAFAASENIMYVLNSLRVQSIYNMPLALSTGVTRALMAVPGHFGFAIMMGFFFSFYLFDRKRKGWFLLLAYIVPVLFHGLYDSFAFMESISGIWLPVITFAFFLVFFVMNNLCVKAIRAVIQLDDKALFQSQMRQTKQQ